MGILLYVAYALAGLTLGAGLASFASRWPRAHPPENDVTRLLDMATTTLLCAFATWVAIAWALSLAGLLTRGGLVAGSVVALAGGAALLYRSRGAKLEEYVLDGWGIALGVVALAPAGLWLAFVAWRGTVLPVYSHDALAYHFPKAALLVQARGFHVFAVPEPRISSWPCDYELLVASVFLVTGSDALTAAISNLAFVGFLLVAARMASAWWGRGLHVALTAALTVSAPLVILHSGLQKNDLVFAFFAVCACDAAGRWYARGCPSSLAIATIAAELALGTKVNGAIVLVGVAVVVALGAWRARAWLRPLPVLLYAGGAAGLSVLLGAWTYVASLAAFHSPALPPELPGDGYGDWSNLWRFTYLLLAVPFSSNPSAVYNPWAHEDWWWPANDVWMSHFGRAFTVLVVIVVPCLLLGPFARRVARRLPLAVALAGEGGPGRPDPGASRERAVTTWLVLFAYALTVPVHLLPIGFFSGVGRYVLFVIPIVLAWTVPPLTLTVQRILRLPKAARLAGDAVLAVAAAALGAQTIWAFGVHDAYAPFVYVSYALDHPEDRRPFVRRNRAASVFDRIAPPDATCAVDVAFDTWIYPAYGAGWTRKVVYLPRTPEGTPVPIADDVDWVIVDRSFHVFFGHPDFTDMGKAWRYLGRGTPTAADLKVVKQLAADARFELVYADASQNQALFRRRGAKTLDPAGRSAQPDAVGR